MMAVLLGAQIALAVWLELKVWRNKTMFKTTEGRLARLMVGTPIFLLGGRSTMLYEPSLLLFGTLAATLAVLLLIASRTLREDRFAPVVRFMSLGPATIASYCLTAGVSSQLLRSGLEALVIPTFTLPLVAYLALVSILSPRHSAGFYRGSAALVALLGASANLFAQFGIGAAFTALLVSTAVVIYSLMDRKPLMALAAVAVGTFSLVGQLWLAIQVYSIGHWGSLALLGLVVIVLASVLDRKQAEIRQLLARMQDRFSPEPPDQELEPEVTTEMGTTEALVDPATDTTATDFLRNVVGGVAGTDTSTVAKTESDAGTEPARPGGSVQGDVNPAYLKPYRSDEQRAAGSTRTTEAKGPAVYSSVGARGIRELS